MEKNLPYKDATVSANGGEARLSQKIGRELSLSYDTNGLTKGYYTAWIGWTQERQQNQDLLLVIGIKSDTNASININLGISENEVVTVADNSYVFLKDKVDSYYQAVKTEYGTFPVQEGFEGSIVIPLSKDLLHAKESEIMNNGLICTQTEDKVTKFTIQSMDYVNKEDSTVFNVISASEQKLVQAEIPTIGEYQYQCDFLQRFGDVSNVRFDVISDNPKVTIDVDGVLTIPSDTLEQMISVQAITEEQVVYTFDVELVNPWYVKQQKAGVAVPEPNQVLRYPKLVGFRREDISIETTLAVIGSMLVYLMVFYLVTRKRKRRSSK